MDREHLDKQFHWIPSISLRMRDRHDFLKTIEKTKVNRFVSFRFVLPFATIFILLAEETLFTGVKQDERIFFVSSWRFRGGEKLRFVGVGVVEDRSRNLFIDKWCSLNVDKRVEGFVDDNVDVVVSSPVPRDAAAAARKNGCDRAAAAAIAACCIASCPCVGSTRREKRRRTLMNWWTNEIFTRSMSQWTC